MTKYETCFEMFSVGSLAHIRFVSVSVGCRSREAGHLHQVCRQRRSSWCGKHTRRKWNHDRKLWGKTNTVTHSAVCMCVCVCLFTGRPFGSRWPVVERGRAQSSWPITREVNTILQLALIYKEFFGGDKFECMSAQKLCDLMLAKCPLTLITNWEIPGWHV